MIRCRGLSLRLIHIFLNAVEISNSATKASSRLSIPFFKSQALQGLPVFGCLIPLQNPEQVGDWEIWEALNWLLLLLLELGE